MHDALKYYKGTELFFFLYIKYLFVFKIKIEGNSKFIGLPEKIIKLLKFNAIFFSKNHKIEH